MKISHLNKAEVLLALYNNSKMIGNSWVGHDPNIVFDIQRAENLLKKQTKFDYLNGKVMKVDLSDDDLVTEYYDRENGVGAAEKALKPLFEKHQRFILEKCTPKLLVDLSAKVVIKNKNLFFSSLGSLPPDLADRFPVLEVDPMKNFVRRVKVLLNGKQFSPEWQKSILDLYTALESSHPYNNIHPIVAGIKAKTAKLYFNPEAVRLNDLCGEIINLMKVYLEDKKSLAQNQAVKKASK